LGEKKKGKEREDNSIADKSKPGPGRHTHSNRRKGEKKPGSLSGFPTSAAEAAPLPTSVASVSGGSHEECRKGKGKGKEECVPCRRNCSTFVLIVRDSRPNQRAGAGKGKKEGEGEKGRTSRCIRQAEKPHCRHPSMRERKKWRGGGGKKGGKRNVLLASGLNSGFYCNPGFF